MITGTGGEVRQDADDSRSNVAQAWRRRRLLSSESSDKRPLGTGGFAKSR